MIVLLGSCGSTDRSAARVGCAPAMTTSADVANKNVFIFLVPEPQRLRHCEERSDEAIQSGALRLDCFASLAMTIGIVRRVMHSLGATETQGLATHNHAAEKILWCRTNIKLFTVA